MKNITFEKTATTGTRVVVDTYTWAGGKTSAKKIICDSQMRVVAIMDNYSTVPSDVNYNLSGTQVETLLKSDYNSILNQNNGYIFQVAKYVQQQSLCHFYDFPIWKIVDNFEKNKDYFKLQCANMAHSEEVFELKKRIKNLQDFGTENAKEINKIKIQREKDAKKLAKIEAKNLAQKIKSKEIFLKQKIKEGYNYIAVMRVWSRSGGYNHFKGESLEFRFEKPTTKTCFYFDKKNIKEVAKKIVKY